MVRSEKTRRFLDMAASIFLAREAVEETGRIAKEAAKHHEESKQHLADLEAKLEAAFADEEDGEDGEDETGPTPTADTPDEPQPDSQPGIVPPWQDPDTGYAERVRQFFTAHPDIELTAVQLQDAVNVPAKNLNQILSREVTRDFLHRVGTGVYALVQRSDATDEIFEVHFGTDRSRVANGG